VAQAPRGNGGSVTADSTPGGLADGLGALRDELQRIRLGLELPDAERARRDRDGLVAQIDDYLLPRLQALDAPLLMVVGGSTGAGKSTLVNSLLGEVVSPAGVLRPTTRAPVLAFHPEDRRWFEDDRIFPELPRTSGGPAAPGGLQLVPSGSLPAGLALLDSPDIDSVLAENRALATQLLAAGDSWLFVTTAARYADAVPWDFLRTARERGTTLSVVLNRVPADAGAEVAAHLRSMLADQGLGGVELLVVPETPLEEGLLTAAALAPVREWLDALAADAQARATLIRRTLTGALDSLAPRVGAVQRAAEDQLDAAGDLRVDVSRLYARALDEVEETLSSGTLLRGEVLARWHEMVGTGDLMRALETRIGRARDRLRSVVTGRPPVAEEIQAAVESSLETVVRAAADRAAERTAAAWRERAPGRQLLAGAGRLDAASPELLAELEQEIRDWQGAVFDLVQREGAGRRSTARLASLGVNGAGLTVMLAVFVQTGGLTGAELAIAGGTSAVGQKVLEAIFGDQAVRQLAAEARRDLLERLERLFALEAGRFTVLLDPVAPDGTAPRALRDALRAVQLAR
jgi:energy-coupling factor transporter ATP-binding protein EcfA2